MAVMTGLSGNEIYCLYQKGLQPGNLVIGNSVFSMGFVGRVGSGLKTLVGGEVGQVTSVIHEGRQRSFDRMFAEAQRHGGTGITGVTSEMIQHGNNVEFLSVGSCLHSQEAAPGTAPFSSAADGQELYCQLDSGFRPVKFVFGNVAYSIGVGGGVLGTLRSAARGEVIEYSRVFNETRHRALERITAEARSAGANAVVGIQTSIVPLRGMQEMVMIGTASHHPALPPQFSQSPASSDLTSEEMWNLVNVGYAPLQLVLGVSVYSLGLIGGIKSALKGLVRGEISDLTTLIYEARENAIGKIANDAKACGADGVAGVKTYVYQLGGGLIEFMAIGTAVKRMDGISTGSPSLPSQAVLEDKDTFINTAETALGRDLNRQSQGDKGRTPEKNPQFKSAWDVIKIVLDIFLR